MLPAQLLHLAPTTIPTCTSELPLQVLTAPKDAQGKEITWRSAAALDGYVRRLSEVRAASMQVPVNFARLLECKGL